jgi:hypothetical protein
LNACNGAIRSRRHKIWEEVLREKCVVFCYNWKHFEVQNYSVYGYKFILFPPEKQYRAKVNNSINSPLSFSCIYQDLPIASFR